MRSIPSTPARPTARRSPGTPKRPLESRRVFIVDDNLFFTQCLAALINSERGLRVCGTAASRASLFDRLALCAPEGIVLDLMLGAENGLQVAQELRRRKIDTPLFLVSALATPPRAALRRLGRCTFWRKGEDDLGFLTHLRRTLIDAPSATARGKNKSRTAAPRA